MYLWYDKVSSPIGTIVLAGRNGRLYALDFDDCRARMHALLQRRFRSVQLERFYNFDGQPEKIRAYFKGDLTALEDIEVETRGTSFQRRVWLALRQIRCGTTISYGVLAYSLGFPSAARAVGLANGLNPIALVIPCHRVIGVQGSLTGYAGGLHRKRWLLTHEQQF
jgi:methylated-DNA-[protein]-cysteine S-methyltransferase